jgi:hypothetical protein
VRNFAKTYTNLPKEKEGNAKGGEVQQDLNKWHQEATYLIENLCLLPLALQYHPRLVVAGYLQWVLDRQIEKEQPIQVPFEVCGHPWYAFIDPAINLEDLTEVKLAIVKGLNSFTAAVVQTQ